MTEKQLAGNSRSQILFGYGGDDNIFAYRGNDTIYGGSGNDSIYGGEGNDILFGGEGNNTVVGGKGNDILVAGTTLKEEGNDIFVGGKGSDEFDFSRVVSTLLDEGSLDRPNLTIIRDFNALEGDTLKIAAQGLEINWTNSEDGSTIAATVGGEEIVLAVLENTFVS